VDELCTRLEPQLKRQLLSSHSSPELHSCDSLALILNTYILLRRAGTVELLYRQLLVRPALLEVLASSLLLLVASYLHSFFSFAVGQVTNEHFIEKNGLDAVFAKLFECCSQLLRWKMNLQSSPYGYASVTV
jgi:hypothetical protein